jgi:archaellum component FlaC
LICVEEIENYHNKIQESIEDLKSSMHHIANVITMTREEVSNQLENMQDHLTELSKNVPSPNDGN